MMASSRLSAASSPSTRAPSFVRSTLPSTVVPGKAASMAGAASPSYRRCTTASASCTGTPASAKNRAVVDLPMPSEPVSPRMNMKGATWAGPTIPHFRDYTAGRVLRKALLAAAEDRAPPCATMPRRRPPVSLRLLRNGKQGERLQKSIRGRLDVGVGLMPQDRHLDQAAVIHDRAVVHDRVLQF